MNLKLQPRVDISGAAALHAAWQEAGASTQALTLDAQAVEHMSAAGAQWVVSAFKTLAAAGASLAVSQPSAAMRADFATLGLSSHLGE